MKRFFSRTVRQAGALALLSFAILPLAICHSAPTDKPNVLFIAIDDLNDWIGALGGHPQTRTPHLDRLAERSVLFANTHCAAPACNPSRAALMTGIPPYRSGIYHNPQPWRPALPDAVTIPQHFSAHGYWSAGAGKIYHGTYADPASWDAYYPSKKQTRHGDPPPIKKNANGLKRSHFDWSPTTAADPEMGDYKTATWTVDQLTRKHDKPFFVACGIFRPHLPWYVPQKYFDMFPLDSIQLPKTIPNDLTDVPKAGIAMAKPSGDHAAVVKGNQWKQAVQGYLASIAFADAQIGRVIDALDAGPHRDNTIVVLWTDHGWHLGEKEHWRKFALWHRATRTPMMISAPKGTTGLPSGSARGKQCHQATSLMDIYPTLIELCGLTPKKEIAGESLVPLLKNPDKKTGRGIVTTHGRNNHAIRDERWRYIRYADGSEELYDHEGDPNEWTNIADDPKHSQTKKRLAGFLPKTNVPDAPKDKKKTGGSFKRQKNGSRKKK